eukprot:gene21455-27488_t
MSVDGETEEGSGISSVYCARLCNDSSNNSEEKPERSSLDNTTSVIISDSEDDSHKLSPKVLFSPESNSSPISKKVSVEVPVTKAVAQPEPPGVATTQSSASTKTVVPSVTTAHVTTLTPSPPAKVAAQQQHKMAVVAVTPAQTNSVSSADVSSAPLQLKILTTPATTTSTAPVTKAVAQPEPPAAKVADRPQHKMAVVAVTPAQTNSVSSADVSSILTTPATTTSTAPVTKAVAQPELPGVATTQSSASTKTVVPSVTTAHVTTLTPSPPAKVAAHQQPKMAVVAVSTSKTIISTSSDEEAAAEVLVSFCGSDEDEGEEVADFETGDDYQYSASCEDEKENINIFVDSASSEQGDHWMGLQTATARRSFKKRVNRLITSMCRDVVQIWERLILNNETLLTGIPFQDNLKDAAFLEMSEDELNKFYLKRVVQTCSSHDLNVMQHVMKTRGGDGGAKNFPSEEQAKKEFESTKIPKFNDMDSSSELSGHYGRKKRKITSAPKKFPVCECPNEDCLHRDASVAEWKHECIRMHCKSRFADRCKPKDIPILCRICIAANAVEDAATAAAAAAVAAAAGGGGDQDTHQQQESDLAGPDPVVAGDKQKLNAAVTAGSGAGAMVSKMIQKKNPAAADVDRTEKSSTIMAKLKTLLLEEEHHIWESTVQCSKDLLAVKDKFEHVPAADLTQVKKQDPMGYYRLLHGPSLVDSPFKFQETATRTFLITQRDELLD